MSFSRDRSLSVVDDGGPQGQCRFRPELANISHALPWCSKYIDRVNQSRYTGKRAVKGRGRVIKDDTEFDEAHSHLPQSDNPQKTSKNRNIAPRVVRPKKYGVNIDLGDEDMDTEALKELMRDVLREEGLSGDVQMAEKFEGGTVVIKPRNTELQAKEVDIDSFFHKVVMVRDRLRVLEAKLNANKNLPDAEKVDLQQYITKAYGSLTTFNVLFADKSDHFQGSKT